MYLPLMYIKFLIATCPDNISNKLLKESSVPIAEPLSHLFNVQLEAARIATGCKSHTSHRQLYSELAWIKLSDRRESNKLKKLYCITRFKTPQYLIDTLENRKLIIVIQLGRHLPNQSLFLNAKIEITKSSFFHPPLDPGIHLIINGATLEVEKDESLNIFLI